MIPAGEVAFGGGFGILASHAPEALALHGEDPGAKAGRAQSSSHKLAVGGGGRVEKEGAARTWGTGELTHASPHP